MFCMIADICYSLILLFHIFHFVFLHVSFCLVLDLFVCDLLGLPMRASLAKNQVGKVLHAALKQNQACNRSASLHFQ